MPLLAFVLSIGCFDSHNRYDGDRCRVPAGMVCCNEADLAETHWESLCPFECPIGRRLVPASECGEPWEREDAGPPPTLGGPDSAVLFFDAGPPPELRCPIERARASCSAAEGLVVVVGEPFELPYQFDLCGCCEEVECAASLDVSSRVISLTTTMCPGPDCDCDGCWNPSGSCEVPALPAAGDWDVHVNGTPAFRLPVRATAGGPENPPGCATYAQDDGCGGSDVLDASPWVPTAACIRRADGGLAIEVRDACGGCAHQGTCVTYLEPRIDRDRPGANIVVTPTAYTGACDGVCDPVCREIRHTCAVPTLPPGVGAYDVIVDGEVLATLGRGGFETTFCED